MSDEARELAMVLMKLAEMDEAADRARRRAENARTFFGRCMAEIYAGWLDGQADYLRARRRVIERRMRMRRDERFGHGAQHD